MITHSNIPDNPLTVGNVENNFRYWLQRLLPSEFKVDETLTDVVLSFNNSDLFGESKILSSSYAEGFLNLYEETDNCAFVVSDLDGSRYKVYTDFCFDYTSPYNPYFFSMTLQATLPRNSEGVSEYISMDLYIQPRQDVVGSMEDLAEALPTLFDKLEADDEELEYASWGRKLGLDSFKHNTLYAAELSRILGYPLSELHKYYSITSGNFTLSLTEPNSRKLTPVLIIRNEADVYGEPIFKVSRNAGSSSYTCN